jgi:homoserine kinase type II
MGLGCQRSLRVEHSGMLGPVNMTEPIARAAANRMEGFPAVLSCQRMSSGFSNSNYRFETSSGVFLLRECTGRDRPGVDYELNVLDWLRAHNFPSSAAIRFGDGERWISGPRGSLLVLLEWLDGSEPLCEQVTVKTIARALGDLHQLPPPSGGWWRRENPNGREAAAQLAEIIEPDDPAHFQFFREEFERLRPRLGEPLPGGLIHGDVFTDNTLFQDGDLVAILDFEDACEDVFLFDVAMTIHGFCFPEEHWRPDLAQAFLDVYKDRRALTDSERELLPTYLRWCPLAIMGWHLRQLRRRPDKGNEKRVAELIQRIETLREASWPTI